MRRIAILLLLFAFHTICFASPVTLPSPAFSSRDSIRQSYNIQFRIVYQLMMVKATVNHKTGYLCIDTGIKGLILNEQLFDGVQLNDGIVNSDGDIIPSESVLARVKMGGLTKTFPDARTADLHHIFKNQSNFVLGMIGWEIFNNNEILIDYLDTKIIVFVLDEDGNRIQKGEQSTPIVKSTSLKFVGQLPFIIAEVGNKKLKLVLDSGATSNVICKSLYQSFRSNNVLVKKVRIRQWGSTSANTTLTNFTGLQIGHITLLPMKTMWYSLTRLNFELRGSEIDGIIGLELFKQYQVGINFRKNEVSLYSYEKDLVRSDF